MKFASSLLVSILYVTSAFADDVTPAVAGRQDISSSEVNQSFSYYAVPRPDLAGMRVIADPSAAVFVINPEGILQHIPSSNTYNKLFKNWDNIARIDIAGIATGVPLFNAALIKGPMPDVYLLSNGVKRPITEAAMGKYNFEWRNIEIYPQYMLDSIPTGMLWQ